MNTLTLKFHSGRILRAKYFSCTPMLTYANRFDFFFIVAKEAYL